ncbi:MAG: hypothetical protein IPM79_22790 [Polyangiaceae bacterium]|nr:hypothetical protein [Polyangiaceae bacterium]
MNTKRLLRAAGAFGVLTVGFGSTAVGCLNRPIDRIDPRTTSTVVERLQQSGVDKIDLLLAIDNSISMADKQQILAAAVPDLVNRLITPNCVDDMGVATGQIVDASGKCPDGSKPEFPPIRDINVGVISSSLGDLTSGACGSASIINPDDRGRLLTRTGSGAAPVDFQGQGFLGWDPDSERGGQANPTELIADLTDMVVGVDQVGCGYEMGLESVLRFLVDPDPYDSLVEESNNLVEQGTDEVVLQQRANFLRPDSLLAILILSDENDCSINVKEQGFLALGGPFYRSTSECKTDPNSECCTSCGLNVPSGCDAGGDCTGAGGSKYDPTEDHQNLKCYRQKERYGVNFLYPTARYVNAFTRYKIDPDAVDYDGDSVVNPLFDDLGGTGGSIRSPDLVFVAGIVGVPWQAIAKTDGSGNPDLSLGFKTYDDLSETETADGNALDTLIGDPDGNVDPTDPFMVQATSPRSGMSELLGYSPSSNNPINGNDWTIYDSTDPNDGPDDLEYACIFPLNTPVTPGFDCDDCTGPECDNPLCQGQTTTQVNAKAYPGLRYLSVLRGMATQGIFASICPAEVSNTGSPIYGYRPAVNTIVDRLKEQLGGQCLPRKLTVDPNTGTVPCLVIEARVTDGNCACNPDEGRAEIPEQVDGAANPTYNAVLAAQQSEFANPDWDCFCEIEQLQTGDAKTECLNNADPDAGAQGDGWCYIDAASVPPVGDPALVASCPADEQRLVRFVGQGDPKTGATVFVTCSGE